jgi:hypothetical protein
MRKKAVECILQFPSIRRAAENLPFSLQGKLRLIASNPAVPSEKHPQLAHATPAVVQLQG